MESMLLNILVGSLIGILVIIGIYQGWKGNKFFNSPFVAYCVFIILWVALGFGLGVHNYNTQKEMGLPIQDDPYSDLGRSIYALIILFIIYAVFYGICYLISGRKR